MTNWHSTTINIWFGVAPTLRLHKQVMLGVGGYTNPDASHYTTFYFDDIEIDTLNGISNSGGKYSNLMLSFHLTSFRLYLRLCNRKDLLVLRLHILHKVVNSSRIQSESDQMIWMKALLCCN